MKRFRLRLSVLLWLVALAAAFLAGVRYEQYRARPRPNRGQPYFYPALPAKPTSSPAGP